MPNPRHIRQLPFHIRWEGKLGDSYSVQYLYMDNGDAAMQIANKLDDGTAHVSVWEGLTLMMASSPYPEFKKRIRS
jgi:hypothetical protein